MKWVESLNKTQVIIFSYIWWKKYCLQGFLAIIKSVKLTWAWSLFNLQNKQIFIFTRNIFNFSVCFHANTKTTNWALKTQQMLTLFHILVFRTCLYFEMSTRIFTGVRPGLQMSNPLIVALIASTFAWLFLSLTLKLSVGSRKLNRQRAKQGVNNRCNMWSLQWGTIFRWWCHRLRYHPYRCSSSLIVEPACHRFKTPLSLRLK